jgi:hypothetical protein
MLKAIYFTPTITPKHHGNGHTTLKSTGSRPSLVPSAEANGRETTQNCAVISTATKSTGATPANKVRVVCSQHKVKLKKKKK